jgi:hypothetical protein
VVDICGLFSNGYQNIAVLGVGSPGPPVAKVVTPGGASAFAYMRGLGNAVLDRFGSIRGLVQVSFVDGGIRGGAATSGYLDSIVAFNDPYGRVTLNRLIFDDAEGGAISGLSVHDAAYPEYVAAAVPEPSGLGLLALGAGGLLARRRRFVAA